jgi:hypothetical protein
MACRFYPRRMVVAVWPLDANTGYDQSLQQLRAPEDEGWCLAYRQEMSGTRRNHLSKAVLSKMAGWL